MNKAIRIVIYVVWGLFSLLMFIYLTFPTDVARDVVRRQAEARLKGYQVQIDDLSLVGLSGVSLEGIRLLPLAGLEATPEAAAGADGEDATEGGDEGPPRMTLPTMIDEARLTVNLLGLLRGNLEAGFNIDMAGGEVFGSWAPHPETEGVTRFDLNLDGVQLPQIGFIANATGALMTGTATGHVALDYEGRTLRGGSVDFRIDNFGRNTGPLPIPGLPAAPYIETPTRMGNLTLVAELEASELNIGTFEAIGGPDLEFQVDGRVSLRTPTNESVLYLTLQLGFSQEWRDANAFGPIIEQVPLLRESCTEDNQCAIALRGAANQLRPQALSPTR